MEVIRGADSARFGSGAIGGAGTIAQPGPATRGIRSGPGRSPGWGSFTTFRAGGDISGTAGPVGLLATGGFFHTDGTFPYVDGDSGFARMR